DDAGEMIRQRIKGEAGVNDGVNKSLDRPIKIRSGCVDEKEMIEAFRNQTPTADERIAQDECGVVPDKTIAQRRRVTEKHRENEQSGGENFFHLDKMRVYLCAMFMSIFRLSILLALLLTASSACAAGVPDDCRQLIVGVAPDWNSIHGKLRLFERADANAPWKPVSPAEAVLFGKTGLAWGSGIAGQDENGLRKTEHDGRAPAGIFRIGKIYTYDAQLPSGADYKFHQVTRADAWVDDPTSPNYNKFVTIPEPNNPPPWFEKQKMRHGDFAYRWLVEIRHNSDPPVPGHGSAIFFHIRRGVN